MTALDDCPTFSVSGGFVTAGRFAGAPVSREFRWECYGRPCFDTADGWRVHCPECETDFRFPKPLPNPKPWEDRAISDAELRASGAMDPVWTEERPRQERAQRAAEVTW